jgi:hypothetical protein
MSASRVVRKLTAPSATEVTPTTSEMEALQVVGLTSLACVAVISMIYGEILLLHRG